MLTHNVDTIRPGRACLVLSPLTGAQIAVSFGLQSYVVAKLGIGTETDAFYAGSILPQVVSGMVIDTLAAVLVPLFSSCTIQELRVHGWSLCAVATVGFLVIGM